MKICKYCETHMLSEYESKPNKAYNAFHCCPNCKAVCDEKVTFIGERKETMYRWYNPEQKEFEEWKKG